MKDLSNLVFLVRRNFLQKGIIITVFNIVFLFGLFCFPCNAEVLSGQTAALFHETQQASVFYLDNGMEIILIENHASPMITAFTIVKTGSRNEDASTNGSAHFLEHLLFNGTKSRTQKELYDEMDFYGGYNNAHTGPDYTNYMILMPKEYIEQGMNIQADMLFNSTLPLEKFEKERGIVIEEIGKSADSPTYQVHNHFLRTLFAGTPYARPVLGTVSTISHLKRDVVLDYYHTWYVPNNMTLMVIGDFTTSTMVQLVKNIYGPYPPGPLPVHKPIRLKPPKNSRIYQANVLGKFSIDRQYLDLGYLLPAPSSQDFLSLQLLSEFLGGREDSILDKLFQQESNKKLLTSISADVTFNRDFSTLQISAELPTKTDVGLVIRLIENAVKSMSKTLIPEKELESTLIARATHEIYMQEKLHYYAMMKSSYLAAGGYAFLRDYMDSMLKVTPQSIQEAASKYLVSQIPVISLMSPPAITTEAEKTHSQNVYHMETLDNGLTTVIKENHDSRVIGIHLLAKDRSLCEGKDKWGMAEILQRMLLEGGTTKHPDEKLNHALESIGAELKLYDNPGIPYDDYYNSPRFTYIRLKVIDSFFEEGFKLLAEMVSQPQLTQDAFERAQKSVISLSNTVNSSTPKTAIRLAYDHLFEQNPGFGWILGDAKKLETVKLEDITKLHRALYNPSNLILTISGNLEIDKVKSLVETYFGGTWGDYGWQAPAFTLKFDQLGKTIHEKFGKKQSYVTVVNTCNVEEKDQPALHILNNIFSSRLAFQLREKQGLAYSIGIHFPKYKDKQWYRISMATRPENIEKAVSGIKEEIRAIRQTTFSDDEVQKTINATLGRRGMRRMDRVSQAYYISMEILDGKTPEADDQYSEKLKKVTPHEVEQLAKKVFQNDDHLIVIVE